VGTIALVGGDEFRDGCEAMDREILAAAGAARPRVLIVPAAAAMQNPSKAAANGVAYFDGLGAETEALMVLDSDGADDDGLVSRIGWADVIYLTGGDPAHLLEVLHGSRMLQAVRRAVVGGAVLAGSSAGAMVLGGWMRYGGVLPALGLLEGLAVFPHHERSRPDMVAAELKEAAYPGGSVLGVDAGAACLGGRDGWRVVGEGSVVLYSRGAWRRFQTGETVPLQVSLPL
jgi:cyanophycinase